MGVLTTFHNMRFRRPVTFLLPDTKGSARERQSRVGAGPGDLRYSRATGRANTLEAPVYRWLVGGILLLSACGTNGAPPQPVEDEPPARAPSVSPPSVQPIDSAIAPAVAGEGGWNYQQSAEADLTGDGRSERVVLTARVDMVRGQPAWDDGQPWQVYVESQDGTRTYVYAQRLQLGTLTMRVSRGEESPSTIVLLEHLPDRLRVLEATYGGPGLVSVAVEYQSDLDPRGETASPRLP